MSFKSVLTKIGEDALLVAQDATKVIPLLQPFAVLIPQIGVVENKITSVVSVDKLQAIFDLSQQAEAMISAANKTAFGLGSEKAAAMTPFVAALVQDVSIIGGAKLGAKIKDPVKFAADCAKLSGVIGDILSDVGD